MSTGASRGRAAARGDEGSARVVPVRAGETIRGRPERVLWHFPRASWQERTVRGARAVDNFHFHLSIRARTPHAAARAFCGQHSVHIAHTIGNNLYQLAARPTALPILQALPAMTHVASTPTHTAPQSSVLTFSLVGASPDHTRHTRPPCDTVRFSSAILQLNSCACLFVLLAYTRLPCPCRVEMMHL